MINASGSACDLFSKTRESFVIALTVDLAITSGRFMLTKTFTFNEVASRDYCLS